MKTLSKALIVIGMAMAAVLPKAGAIPGVLEEKEKQNLLYLREEEKLARDLYTDFYEKWGLRPFGNILEAEKRHMEAIKFHLDAYGLKDPIQTNVPGKFSNPSIQKNFDELLAKGLRSEQDAIEAGVTVEEASIKELQTAINESDEPALNQTYLNLLNASKNHLRAFQRWLGR